MPTGYTAGVADGSITSLKDFAFICARALGVCITMRDDSLSVPIPHEFEPSNYHKNALFEAQYQLESLTYMHESDKELLAKEEFLNKQRSTNKEKLEKQEQRIRYENMIKQVDEWKGAPEGIKEFMRSQLYDSIKFDCPSDDPFKIEKELKPLTASEWYKKEEKRLLNEIAYHSKSYAEELDRVVERNKWLKQLRESLNDT